MKLTNPEKVAFDCPVFAQALINPRGPAAACLAHAQRGRLLLFVSDYMLQEIRELPHKLRPQLGVTSGTVERLIDDLAKYAQPVGGVPPLYTHPIDPDDSHYINLAIATKSKLIVTRDRHLLNLMDDRRKEANDFKYRFPDLMVITPDALTELLRKEEQTTDQPDR
jgi:putative PIN family toxin of toxin-antitoxin system